MKISGNFSAPSFKRLYPSDEAHEKMRHLALNQRTSKVYGETYDALKMVSADKDISLDCYGDGVNIREIDPKTGTTLRYIAKDGDSFINGMRSAIRKLVNLQEPVKEKKPRKRFEGHC